MQEAIFPEGPAFFRGTFRPFRFKPERFCVFGDGDDGIFVYICIVDRLIDQDEDEQKDLPDRNPVVMERSLPPGPAGG